MSVRSCATIRAMAIFLPLCPSSALHVYTRQHSGIYCQPEFPWWGVIILSLLFPRQGDRISPHRPERTPVCSLCSSLCSLAGLEAACQLHPMAVQTRFHYGRQHQKDPRKVCWNTKLRDVGFIYLFPSPKSINKKSPLGGSCCFSPLLLSWIFSLTHYLW